jgi:serine/threonine protein kinase
MRIPKDWLPTGIEYESGQAWVNQVRRDHDPAVYALKQLKNPKRSSRFRREVEAMLLLRDEGVTSIPPVVAFDLEQKRPWFVMPWYESGSLDMQFWTVATSKIRPPAFPYS